MILNSKILVAGALAATTAFAAVPASAGDGRSGGALDRAAQERLDRTGAEYSQWRGRGGYRGGYRGGWRGGNRGAAVAAGVAAGVLGGAAIAASRPGYGYYEGYYDEPGYAYDYAPAPRYGYAGPTYYERGYYPPRGSAPRTFEGKPDPAGSGR